MCGILLIDGVSSLDPERIAAAKQYLARRGTNFMRHWYHGDRAIWHSVLHITGSEHYYHAQFRDEFCAFAGEIYNYRDLGYDSDAWCVHDTVRNRIGRLQHLEGPSSWVYSTKDFVCYATDAQGERHLYRYQDQHRTIVASEVAVIVTLLDLEFDPVPYRNKTWCMLHRTPYQGIEKLEPGRIYINHETAHEIDSVFEWCRITPYPSLRAAREEFRVIWQSVMQDLRPAEPCTISFSGGIDSGLISATMPGADLLAIDMIGKDPNIAKLPQYLADDQQARLVTVPVTPQMYARHYRDMIDHTRMPAQSWSHVGKWLVSKHAGNRVIFTGAGADELFGGYAVYQTIDYDVGGSHSPYSHDHDHTLWCRCLAAYDQDPRPATLLLDYWHQVIGCDSPGLDRASGAWARETRNPFMHPRIMRFALGLPWDLRVTDTAKPVLRALWQDLNPDHEVLPKQGFAGHANDSAPWLGVNIEPTGDRYRDWQQIAQHTFYDYCRIA